MSKRIMIPLAGAACLGLIVVTLFLYTGKRGATVAAAPVGCSQSSSIITALTGRGFTPDQYVIKDVNWDASEANTRGQASFATQTPRSADELIGWIGGDTPQAQSAFKAVSTQSGATKEAVLDKANWVPVQFNTSFQLPGNTGFKNGELFSAGTRQSASGDIIWFFAQTKSCGDVPVVVRAGCGNPQTELPKPNPTPPPSPTPTNPLAKGPDRQPAPCVDNAGVRCDGIPGSGGSPGNGGAVDHGSDGYSPQDPPPTTIVKPVPPPTSVVTIPPTTTPPTTMITAPPG